MTAEQFLNQVRQLQAAIRAKEERLAELRTLAEKCTAVLSAAPGGTHSNRTLESMLERILAEEEEQDALRLRLGTAYCAISDTLYALDNNPSRTLLREYYLDGQSVPQLAARYDRTNRAIRVRLQQARESFAMAYASRTHSDCIPDFPAMTE